MKKSLIVSMAFMALIVTAYAFEPPPGDHRKTGDAVGKVIKKGSQFLHELAVDTNTKRQIKMIESNVRKKLENNQGNGVLVKVVIDKAVDPVGNVVKDVREVVILGSGNSMKKILKEYHSKGHIKKSPINGYSYDKDSSKLLWYTKDRDELKRKDINQPYYFQKKIIEEIQNDRSRIAEEERRRAKYLRQQEQLRKQQEKKRKAEQLQEERRAEEARRRIEQIRIQQEQLRRQQEIQEMQRRQQEMHDRYKKDPGLLDHDLKRFDVFNRTG